MNVPERGVILINDQRSNVYKKIVL